MKHYNDNNAVLVNVKPSMFGLTQPAQLLALTYHALHNNKCCASIKSAERPTIGPRPSGGRPL